MNIEISIRIATKTETPKILDVINYSYNTFKNTIPANCGFNITLDELNEIVADPCSMVWLAIHDNNIVGVAAGSFYSPKSYHLKLLFVSENIQRNGVGELLLIVFEKYGKENDCCLFTTNYQKWAPWSGKFYIKHGYNEYIPGDEMNTSELQETVIMRKKIGKLNNNDKCFVWKNVK